MRIRRVAILVDGAFFLKRLRHWPQYDRKDPAVVAEAVRVMCKRHILRLTGENTGSVHWLDHVYRLFFYDALPFEGAPYHPLLKRQQNFASSAEAGFRRALFDEIRRKRKFALRLGTLKRDGDWMPYNRHQKALLKIWHHAEYLTSVLEKGEEAVEDQKSAAALDALLAWRSLRPDDVRQPLRQKGVDMKIGLDITSMTLKGQVDTIILVTGDSDFIPAAKVARREGVEFILDPMWQSVDDDLMEHIDGLTSGFDRPGADSGTDHERD